MEIKERVYPSTEHLFVGYVNDEDLFAYIYHGFALIEKDGEEKFYSYCFDKPMLAIAKTPEAEEEFRQKETDKNNISGLTRIFAKLKVIQVHFGDTPESWERIEKELAKEEYKAAINNFPTTVENLKNRLFPNSAK